MTPEEHFTIVHLNNVKDHLNDAFKELSKITKSLAPMHAIRLINRAVSTSKGGLLK